MRLTAPLPFDARNVSAMVRRRQRGRARGGDRVILPASLYLFGLLGLLPVVALGAGADDVVAGCGLLPACGSGPGALSAYGTKTTTNTTTVAATPFLPERRRPSPSGRTGWTACEPL